MTQHAKSSWDEYQQQREETEGRRVELNSNGCFALVDEVDFDRINAYRWWLFKTGNILYAQGKERSKSKRMYMHRVVLPGFEMLDHINHDGLDNRRENLRPCTASQNHANQRKRTEHTSSKYKGVHWAKDRNKWRASICVEGRWYKLGAFNTEEEAATVYNAAAQKAFGVFAGLNLLDD